MCVVALLYIGLVLCKLVYLLVVCDDLLCIGLGLCKFGLLLVVCRVGLGLFKLVYMHLLVVWGVLLCNGVR